MSVSPGNDNRGCDRPDPCAPPRPGDAWQQRFVDRFYRRRPGWIDGTTQFHQLLQKHLPERAEVLELGPGPANATTRFLSAACAALDGLDVSPEVQHNPLLRQAHVYDGRTWPLADATYDAVVADYVLEHLADPRATVAEACRLLRPGGVFFFRTPNLWHYVSLVARCSPQWFHHLVADRLRHLSREADHVHPTYYRMNRPGTIRAILSQAGLTEVELVAIEKEPSYGMSSRVLFFAFMVYERVVNSAQAFSGLRANLLGAFRKPGGAEVRHSGD